MKPSHSKPNCVELEKGKKHHRDCAKRAKKNAFQLLFRGRWNKDLCRPVYILKWLNDSFGFKGWQIFILMMFCLSSAFLLVKNVKKNLRLIIFIPTNKPNPSVNDNIDPLNLWKVQVVLKIFNLIQWLDRKKTEWFEVHVNLISSISLGREIKKVLHNFPFLLKIDWRYHHEKATCFALLFKCFFSRQKLFHWIMGTNFNKKSYLCRSMGI